MSDAAREEMAMLKRRRLVRKKLKEVSSRCRATVRRRLSARACRRPARCRPPRRAALSHITPAAVCVQIARLEEIRNSGTRELNEDELNKVSSAEAFREEVRAKEREREEI